MADAQLEVVETLGVCVNLVTSDLGVESQDVVQRKELSIRASSEKLIGT